MKSLERIPRLLIADLPTPLEEAPRLAAHLGIGRLFIKRDDQTGLALGGNKARKLEYDFAEIVAHKYDTVLTVGGAQSNHARMTAAIARKLGIDVKLVLGGPPVTAFHGNLLLDVILGAEIRYLENNDRNEDLEAAMKSWHDELCRRGRKPYSIPIGGSTGLSALGYVRAMLELSEQVPKGPVQIILAVGSCGTLAGAILGTRLFLPDARVIGISVSRTSRQIAKRTLELIAESSEILGIGHDVPESRIETYDIYHEEYGVPTDSGKQAILTCARLEGTLLDPVYTGKAMAGLMDLTKRNIIDKSIPTVFLHTGGIPIAFAFENEFQSEARFAII